MRLRLMPRHNLAVSVLYGTLGYEDLLAHRARMASDRRYSPALRLLFDVRRITRSTLSNAEIRAFAEFGTTGRPRFAKMAMLVGNDLGFGLARTFEAYSGRHDERTLQTFRDPRVAWAWLKADDL